MENYFKKETFYNIGQDLFKNLEKDDSRECRFKNAVCFYLHFFRFNITSL